MFVHVGDVSHLGKRPEISFCLLFSGTGRLGSVTARSVSARDVGRTSFSRSPRKEALVTTNSRLGSAFSTDFPKDPLRPPPHSEPNTLTCSSLLCSRKPRCLASCRSGGSDKWARSQQGGVAQEIRRRPERRFGLGHTIRRSGHTKGWGAQGSELGR